MLIKSNCDNENGTINWRNRASLLTLMGYLAGSSLNEVLEGIGDNKKLAGLIKRKWKIMGKKIKDSGEIC